MKAPMLLVVLLGLAPAAALAHGSDWPDPNLHVNPALKDCSIQFAPELTQGAFHRFVREFGSVSAFKQMAPPTTLGRLGVSVALEGISFTVEEHSDAWNDTFYHPDATHELGSSKQFPKLRLRAGVTDRIDLGAFFAENPNANYGWLGLEARYGVLRQGETMPVSLAVRGAWTKTLYVDDMDMQAATLDVSAGRTFRSVFTPYVGVGADAILARETTSVVNLAREEMVVYHATAGAELRYWRLALGAEAQVSALTNFQVQVATVF